MRDAGILERLDRGLYRLTDLPPLSDPDLVTAANKIPKGVICLISALNFHDITTQIPHAVSIAVSRGTEPPRLDYPPIQLYWFTGEAYRAGIETHRIDSIQIPVYSAEKTLADCFKYRNKIGMDTVLEALTLYRDQEKPRPRKLIEYAKVCRVEKVCARICKRYCEEAGQREGRSLGAALSRERNVVEPTNDFVRVVAPLPAANMGRESG